MAKKGGGSQLSQLKSRLHSDGITDRRQMKASAKKRKRGQAGAERDEMDARRDKLSKIASSSAFNPFEEKVTKPKNAVLGRRIKGATGRPGEAKMGGLKERRERLLPEWQSRNKSGSFVDRRFGENGQDDLSMEEKMLERFTRERQSRAGKSTLYNLDDAEEEGLTHYGKSLNDLDDYDDIHLSDEEGLEEEGAHFGGFEEDKQADEGGETEERVKSKAEVMKEVMAKSKQAKFERQQTRVADDEIRNELDNELGDIRSLLFEQPKLVPSASEEPLGGKRPLVGDGTRKDAYDSAVRELAFERRAKPQDRLKTEAEKAEELAEKLKKAEDDRLKRMRGEEVVADQNQRVARNRTGGGDDLEDDFELDGMTSRDVYGLGQGLGTGPHDDEDSEEEDDGENDEEDDDDDDDERSNDSEEQFADLADVERLAQPGEEDEVDFALNEEALTSTMPKGKGSRGTAPVKVLPFTFACPATHDDLVDILEANDVSPAQVPTVLKRIRALHHPSLAENNKFKLQAFLGVLLDHVVYTSSQLSAQDAASPMHVINAIVPQIFSLAKVYPTTAAEHFVSKLALMQRNLTRGLARGPLLPDSKTWPGLTECIVLKLASTIWPASDRSHPVATPLSILISQYLSSSRVRTVSDLASGLFLSCITYNCERQSKRLRPEALNFLHNAVTLLAPVQSTKVLRQVNQAFGIPWPDFGLDDTKGVQMASQEAAPREKLSALSLIEVRESTGEDGEEAKATIMSACLSLIADFATLYTGSTAFVELFTPFQAVLGNFSAMHPVLEEKCVSLRDNLARMVANAKRERRALRLQAHRAIAIASHVPKFDQGFNPERRGGRTFDPDTERAEQAKLRSLLKKERKGAIRELRRDNEFLANVKHKEREAEDKRYKKSIDKIVGSLSSERSEQKKYLQEKERLKKRSGKK